MRLLALNARRESATSGRRVRCDQTPIAERPQLAGPITRSLGGKLLGLRDPAFHAAGQPDLLADPVRGLGRERGNLPVVEDAEVVEFLLDRGRDVGELLEVVGNAAGA